MYNLSSTRVRSRLLENVRLIIDILTFIRGKILQYIYIILQVIFYSFKEYSGDILDLIFIQFFILDVYYFHKFEDYLFKEIVLFENF